MTQSIIDKWTPILNKIGITGSKSDWMSQYVEKQQSIENSNNLGLFPSFLPIAMRVSAQTVGMNLVSVSPMPMSGLSTEEVERIENEIKQENRDSKIDSIVSGKEYVEKKKEDHPDWVNGPKINLCYLDYQYGGSTQSQGGRR